MSRKHASPADRAVIELLVQALRAAFALESGALEEVEPPPGFADINPLKFINAVKTHRVSQLLDEHAAALHLPADIANEMRNLARMETLKAMTLAQETARAWSTLSHAGIPALVMKGVVLSVQTTGRLTSRGDGDIDLLVAPEHMRESLEVLTEAGWKRQMPRELSDEWWPWFSRVAREASVPGTRANIDLHWRITQELRLLEPTQTLLERSEMIEIAGERVRVLNEDDVLHATCYAFQLDRFTSLRMSLDVARLVRRRTRPSAAMPRRLERMVEEAVLVAQQLVGGVASDQIRNLHIDGTLGTRSVRRGLREPIANLAGATRTQELSKGGFNRHRHLLWSLGTWLTVHRFDDQRWARPARVAAHHVLVAPELRPQSSVTPTTKALAWAVLRSLPRILRDLRPLRV